MFNGLRDAYLMCVPQILALMCNTYCEEEHAVHSEGGVTGVEGQSGEDKGIKYKVLHKNDG